MRLLIVDDDPDFRRFLELGLSDDDVSVTTAGSGEEALQALAAVPPGHFDLIVLDVQMPGVSGWDLLYDLREAGRELPVIFVTGLGRTAEKVRGLGLGADDYVVKPVDIEELRARIETVLRRRRSVPPIEYGELRIDLARHNVERNGTGLDLSPREFDLLLCLVQARGDLVSRQDLLRVVWNTEFDPGTNVVDVHIGRLRRKLDRHGEPLIENERGKGYRVVARLVRDG